MRSLLREVVGPKSWGAHIFDLVVEELSPISGLLGSAMVMTSGEPLGNAEIQVMLCFMLASIKQPLSTDDPASGEVMRCDAMMLPVSGSWDARTSPVPTDMLSGHYSLS